MAGKKAMRRALPNPFLIVGINDASDGDEWYSRSAQAWSSLGKSYKNRLKSAQQIEETADGEHNLRGSCDFCRHRGFECKTYTKAFRETYQATDKCSRCYANGEHCVSTANPLLDAIVDPFSETNAAYVQSLQPSINIAQENMSDALQERLAASERENDALRQVLEVAQQNEIDQERKIAELEERYEALQTAFKAQDLRLQKYKNKARRRSSKMLKSEVGAKAHRRKRHDSAASP